MRKAIRCSELGQIARCPHAVKLKRDGASVSQDAKLRMSVGDVAHNKFNDELRTPTSGLGIKIVAILAIIAVIAWVVL